MLMALSLASVLFLAGQTSTQSAQPVQSSAATCSVNFKPFNSGIAGVGALEGRGRALRAPPVHRPSRGCVACGQMATHFPHWMQIFSSQTGMSSARLRFSYCAVAVGNVPSARKRADGQVVALAGGEPAEHVLHELRRVRRERRQQAAAAVHAGPAPAPRADVPACCPRP